jgi:hypothetical protein
VDEALKAAWRAAQANPDDAQARAAYGQALLRSGRRLAALLELGDAYRLGTGRMSAFGPGEVAIERPLRAGGPPLRWGAPLRPADLPGVAPPSESDARLGHVLLVHQDDVAAIAALVPWPSCPACDARRVAERPVSGGSAECDRCDGRGVIIEFTGRAEEHVPCDRCGGTGIVTCARCDGGQFVPRTGRHLRCDHDPLGTTVQDPVVDGAVGLGLGPLPEGWTVHRCPSCGLCVLRDPPGDLHPACAGCGTFACDGTCDVSTGSDP